MCNEYKTSEWRRFWAGVAVCTGFVCAAFSPSYGSVCLLGDEGCIGDPTYSSVPALPQCDDSVYVDCSNDSVIQEHLNNGEGCREVYYCPGKCYCEPLDCQGMGYTLPGSADVNKWPNAYRKTLPNGTEVNNTDTYTCEVCTIKGQKRMQNGIYYWKCNSKIICPNEEDTAHLIPKGKTALTVKADLKAACEADDNVFIEGSSKNSNYVCGHCGPDPRICIRGGVPEDDIPEGCYEPCTPTNETYTKGGETKRCCHFLPMEGWDRDPKVGEIQPQEATGYHRPEWDDTCYTPSVERTAADGKICYKQFVMNADCEARHGCKVKINEEDDTELATTTWQYADYMTDVVSARAANNPDLLHQAQQALYENGQHDCSGFVWNDRLGNPQREQDKCSCAVKPCSEGSATEANRPMTEMVDGVEQNVCYENDDFVGWSGTEVCLNSKRKSRDCEEGWTFDVETCQCVPLECPDGWDVYSYYWLDSKKQLADGTYIDDPIKVYNYDSSGNPYFLTGVGGCGDAKSSILTSGNKNKGWTYTDTDENGKKYLKAIKLANGTWDITHYCGKCTRKDCEEGHQTKEKCGEITKLSDSEKRTKVVYNEYSGDEQCYICDICWNVDDARNACHQEIVEKGLITCVSESGNRYGVDPTPVCVCDEAEYYTSCYEVVPNPNCSIVGNDLEGCTQYIIPNNYSNSSFYMYDRYMNLAKRSTYDNGYYVAKGKCQYTNNSAHPGYQVAYIAECTAEHTCNGHGPAWNPDTQKAMVTCTGTYEYGVMENGGSPVYCGGQYWYDRCETDSCNVGVSECSDSGSHYLTTESTSSYYYSPSYGRLESSSGNGYYYSKRRCAYGHLDYEEWFYDSCTTARDCNGDPGPGYGKHRYKSGEYCSGSPTTCGDYYNGYIYFYEEGECSDISSLDAGSVGGGTSGKSWSVCSSTQYCDGNEWKYTAPDGKSTTYCDNCVEDTCLSTTSFSESGCTSSILTTSKSPSWGDNPYYNDGCSGTGYSGCSYYSYGTYVVKQICESHDGKIRKYAVATCNTDSDCSGEEGPAKGKQSCSYGGSGSTSCGGNTYYDECYDPEPSTPSYPTDSCPSGDSGWSTGSRSTSATAPSGKYEADTCTSDGTTYHYYVYCNSESASGAPAAGMMECNGSVRSGASSVSCGGNTYTNSGECIYTCNVEYTQSDCSARNGTWSVGSGDCANMNPPGGTCTISGVCFRSPGIQCN